LATCIKEYDMAKQLSFEQALARLEETVAKLEAGNLPLEEAVSFFEEGTRLARLCNERLDAAELKVSQLTQAPDGQYVETPLAAGSESSSAGAGA
jgi:exodeoxyribonuclease VII small subunit